MKYFIFILCFACLSGFSQTDETQKIRKHEVGLDFFDLAIAQAVDISYEYVKNPEFGFGISVQGVFGDGFDERYNFTPFFRYYFFSNRDYGSKGFYAEGFFKCFGGKTEFSSCDPYDFYNSHEMKKFFDAAFGVGLGQKFVSKNGLILDLNIGAGRTFGLSERSPDFTGRFAVTFGYRF